MQQNEEQRGMHSEEYDNTSVDQGDDDCYDAPASMAASDAHSGSSVEFCSSREELDEEAATHSPREERGGGFSRSNVADEAQTSGTTAAVAHAPIATVGLINEGCTCYLNSLLQLLFHISYFRSSVYRIPVEDSTTSVYKALQELFFQMQERTTPASTKKLTDAFGWGEQELFVQHDIQEMATLLRDNLEEKMKGTVTEGAINRLFEGCGEQFVETLDKQYISRSKDVFYDIHLPLSRCDNIMDSLLSQTAKDQLVGDNKYRVEVEGQPPVYKDAEKGYEFIRFPPVIWFHLKRFAMDMNSPTLEMVKVNSRMEFPTELDLRSLEKGSSATTAAEDEAAPSSRLGSAVQLFQSASPAIYDLHGVIVHRGTVRSGHYYCYIRDWDPEEQRFTRWIEFEDENVRVVSEEEAVQRNFGGPTALSRREGECFRESGGPPMSNANAYILSYVRRADTPVLLAPSPTDIIPLRVKEAMMREMEEEERRARVDQEIKRALTLHVITDAALLRYCRLHQLEFFARDYRTTQRFAECTLDVKKADPVDVVYEALEREPALARRGVTASTCRLWRWSNGSLFRPSVPLAGYRDSHHKPWLLRDYLSAIEMEKPLTLCLYLQEAAPPPPPAVAAIAGVLPLVRHFDYNTEREVATVQLREPTALSAVVLFLDARYTHACNTRWAAQTDAGTIPTQVTPCTVSDGFVRLSLDPTKRVKALLCQCSTAAEMLPIYRAHLEASPAALPLPAEPPAAWALCQPGHDRVLLFLKYFDHPTSAVRYLGSVLVDGVAKLGCCEPIVLQRMGAVEAAGKSPTLRFFEEGRGGIITRELPADLDIAGCRLGHGSVVVAQAAVVAPVYRHISVEMYYLTLASLVNVRLLEVVPRTYDNREHVLRCLQEHKKLAAALLLAAQSPPVFSANEEQLAEQPSHPQPHASQAVKPAKASSEVVLDGNPYNTSLPPVLVVTPEVVGSTVCRMSCKWTYEAVCDAIGGTVGIDPSHTRLYRYTTTAGAESQATEPLCSDDVTPLEDMTRGSPGTSELTLFYERTARPRATMERRVCINVTLRDAAGHALHHQRYDLPHGETRQGLVRAVRDSIAPWELTEDPWGTLQETCAATHFILVAFDARKSIIYRITEISLAAHADGTSAEEVKLNPAYTHFVFDLQPRPPLLPGEERVACCHGDRTAVDGITFGHPFVITINETTPVQDGLDMMLKATNLSMEDLNEASTNGVMMLTEIPRQFLQYNQFIHLFWTYTENHSDHIPSLMLNHTKPREKPGSRYVAQNNPKLKIASN